MGRTLLSLLASTVLVMSIGAVARATETAATPSAGFAFGEFANNRMSDTRIGVHYDTMSIGFNALYFPEKYGSFDDDGEKVGAMAFGLYGEAETPALTDIGGVKLTSIWSGLSLRGFADLNIAYNPVDDAMFIAPGAGAYVGMTKYMAMAFRAYYPMSNDDDAVGGVDFNSMYYSLGLVIRTK